MKKLGLIGTGVISMLAVCGIALLAPIKLVAQTDSICAVVKLELLQKATLEREAFDAHLTVNNGDPSNPMTNFKVQISFKDSDGNSIDQSFFVKITTLAGTNALDGTGVIQSSSTADIHWLIIPSAGTGGASPSGQQYGVSAHITGSLADAPQDVTTFDAFITVHPQPAIKLEYVLPYEVFGDEPLTAALEPIEPFPLGLRVTNVGYGTARNFQIDSAQPKITENKLGLLIDFKLLGSVVSGKTVPNTLLIPFGDVAPGGVSQAEWIMSTSLSGRFIEFTSTFTHAADLGGQLTSLLQSVTTYTLIKDAMVDLPGRDTVPDFLVNMSMDREAMQTVLNAGGTPPAEALLESDQPQTIPVTDVAGTISGVLSGTHASLDFVRAPGVSTGVWVRASTPFPLDGRALKLISARRSDGKVMNLANVWISKHFRKSDTSVLYRVNVLDLATEAQSYTLNFDPTSLDAPPAAVADFAAATAGSGGLSLAWSAPGEDGNQGQILGGRYLIETSEDANATFVSTSTQINFSTTTSPGDRQIYLASGLIGNTTHYLRLWTQDTGGAISGVSNGATAYVLPYPPKDIAFTSITAAAISTAWQVGNNRLPISYQVSASSTAGGVVLSSSPIFDSFTRAFVFAGLSPNATVYFSGTGLNPETGASSGASPLGSTVTYAAAPFAGPMLAILPSSVTASWGLAGNPTDTEFYAELSTSPDRVPVLQAAGWVRATTAVFGGLSQQTVYYGRVKARNRVGIETAFTDLGAATLGAGINPPLAAAGVSFVLTGVNFGVFADANTRVRFGAGGPLAPIATWSNSRITGTVPTLSTGTYAVYVERQSGASVTSVPAGVFTAVVPAASNGPVLSLTPADGDEVTTSTPSLIAAYSDSGSSVIAIGFQWSLDGINITTRSYITASSAAFVPVAALSEGTHTVTASVYDAAGTTATASANFLVDTLAPRTSLQVNGLAASATTLLVVSTDSLSLAASDAGSGVADTAYLVDVNPNSCDFSYFISTAPAGTCANPYYGGAFTLSTGAHVVAFYSDDDAGNAENYTYVSLAVRNPVYATASADGVATLLSGTTGETVTLVAASTAAVAAVAAQGLTPATSFYDLSPSGFVFDAPATLQFRFNPGALPTSTLAIYSFNGVTWDSAPVAGQGLTTLSGTAVLLSGSLAHASQYAVFASSPAAAPRISISFSTPSFTAASGAVTVGTQAAVSLTVVDTGTPASILYSIDATTPTVAYAAPFLLTAGTHTLYYAASGFAGNAAAVSSATVTVTSGPFITSVTPSSAAVGVPVTINGFNFRGRNTSKSLILFGLSTGTVTSWNDTQIVGKVPGLSTRTYALSVVALAASTQASPGIAFDVVAPRLDSIAPSAGPAGITALLYGGNFGPLDSTRTRVLFAGTTAQIYTWSDSVIKVDVPAASTGAVAVQVERQTTDGGDVLSNTLYFTMQGMLLSSVSPSTGPTGRIITLTGASFGAIDGNNTRVRVGPSTGTVVTWTDTQVTAAVPFLDTGTYSLSLERVAQTSTTISNFLSFNLTPLVVGSVDQSSGPIGTILTVTGTGYGPSDTTRTRVLWDGSTTAYTTWNDTTIAFRVPGAADGPHAFRFERQGRNGGTQRSDDGSFTVATPRLYSVSQSSAPIGNAGIILTGFGFGAKDSTRTRVMLGSASAAVATWNDVSVKFTVPPSLSTGAYALAVERDSLDGMTVRTSSLTFTVLRPTITTMTPNFGVAGALITMTGYGFGPSLGSKSQVLLNGSTVQFTTWNDTMIKWKVPSGVANGTYTVVAARLPTGGYVESNGLPFTIGSMALASFGLAAPTSLAAQPDQNFEAAMSLPADEGGRIESVALAAVSVPANALGDDTVLSIKRLRSDGLRTDAADAAKVRAAGEPIEFGPEGTRFNTPVTIELPYDPALTSDESQLSVNYYDPLRRVWMQLPSVVDRTRHVVTAQTDHFSIYQPMGLGPTSIAQDEFYYRDQYAFPNPARGGGAVTFRIQPGLAETIELRVYDLAGRKIHDSTDFTFLGAFDDGNGKGAQDTYDHVWSVGGVGSGVYSYVIKASHGGQKPIVKSGKVGVIK
jgi:hypothetical protein